HRSTAERSSNKSFIAANVIKLSQPDPGTSSVLVGEFDLCGMQNPNCPPLFPVSREIYREISQFVGICFAFRQQNCRQSNDL
ncbi:MAG: hypothetical protein WAM72_25100, partial [Xanthobacteraceae bacterium]